MLGSGSVLVFLNLQLGMECGYFFFHLSPSFGFYKCSQPSVTATPRVSFLPCLHLQKAIRNCLSLFFFNQNK